ncbi:baseplate J/gp47 family protein [Clostridium botulinum]|nr:baseplate J/gp47 family protein [Clostridium botulinum]NFI17145.1 baseplate J/gp47 family protein [Clostridium botulinum]NFL92824.1 baseplate J/gp47 family protein [Clostridium botulinum]NFN51558.1 baseplate J/gp47 family protein [Clostridium botulinum]NFO27519.1 baseplate J/gp47 family protein [Clostridium botulinum]
MAYYKSAEDIYEEMFLGYDVTDTSEGSLIYNACMPVCMKLSQSLLDLDEATKKVFASSAVESGYSSYLERRIKEVGIERKQPTYASTKIYVNGSPNANLKADSIVGIKDNRLYLTQNDLVLDQDGHGEVIIRAEKPGSKYNAKVNEINYLPIKYNGITSISNKEAVTNGYDIESDEDLYNRYLLKVRTPATSGNPYHYKQWCLEVEGCGSAKIYEETNDKFEAKRGSVLCVISNSNKKAASKELIDKVKEHIEKVRPVGATVFVVSVQELLLNISVSLIYNSKEFTLDKVKENIINSIEEYLKKVALEVSYISIAKVGALILSSDGIEDYNNLTINGSTSNITVKENQIAVLGEVVCNAT